MVSLLNNKSFKEELLESYLGPYRDRFTYHVGYNFIHTGDRCLKSKKVNPDSSQFQFKRYCIELVKDHRSAFIVLSEEWGECEGALDFLESFYCKVISINLADPCGHDILQDVLTNQFKHINENIR